MAIDETIAKPKPMTASTHNFSMTQNDNTNKSSHTSQRVGHLLVRKQRIERWAYKGRSSSIGNTATTTSASLATISAQKRSESTYSQIGRKLNSNLVQLSEQRQKVIERRNFDQKLFANRQALKHKDNPAILRTLNYVRKCCKYADTNDDEENHIDPKIFLEENSSPKRSQSRSPSATPSLTRRNLSANVRTQTSASLAETFLKHNKKHIRPYGSSPISRKLTESKTNTDTTTMTNSSETPVDDDSQKRHVQFRIHTDGTYITSQSAHVISKSHPYNVDEQIQRNITSANGIQSSSSTYDTRTTNSAPPVRIISSNIINTNEQIQHSPKSRRSLSRISSAKGSLQEFRLHPERFLSASNRYLPLLRRQTTDIESRELYNRQQKEKNDSIKKQRINFSPPISRLSDGSDLTYDEAKSFLSEDNDIGKYTPRTPPPSWMVQDRKNNKKIRPSSKIDMMQTATDDTLERTMAIARLRDREYAHLNELIGSNSIEQILEPFSKIKTDEINQIDFEQQKVLSVQRQPIESIANQSPLKSTKIRQLGDILHSIDSLRCSDTNDGRARRKIDLEKNRAKLGILIF
ncbi:unnamed protein product [Rotaria sp. Silwood1]|nr:unnamed protein product [Rotaria sp. Silwood1]CAF4596658.1 unnamed protein product [Rotaria sp. Silwood1]CAF4610284.1 unnamed protein product [Rotaria sp. Silwood1]